MIYHPLSITIPTSSPIMKLVSILIEWISKPLPQYRGQQELKTVFIVKFMQFQNSGTRCFGEICDTKEKKSYTTCSKENTEHF